MNKKYLIFVACVLLFASYVFYKEYQIVHLRAEKWRVVAKYNDNERKELEETFKEIILLKDKAQSLNELITIREDRMDNPQKRWYVQDGVLLEF